MRVSKTEIHIGSRKQFWNEVRQSIGKPILESKHILFLQPHIAQSFFTRRRLELIHAVKTHPTAGVSELARLLHRKQEAVSRDVTTLKHFRILEDGMPTRAQKNAAISVYA